jgi:[ribosomal protein S18]-alanine N-acetyltransferase
MVIANLTVRPFQPDDLASVSALEQSSVVPQEQRPLERIQSWLSSGHEQGLVAVLDGQIVGYAGYDPPVGPFSRCVSLHRIVVQKELRRRGIGQALLDEVIRIAAEYQDRVFTNSVPVEDKVVQQFLYKNRFKDAGMHAYQCTHCNMVRE